jgi:hypothetical protein
MCGFYLDVDVLSKRIQYGKLFMRFGVVYSRKGD